MSCSFGKAQLCEKREETWKSASLVKQKKEMGVEFKDPAKANHKARRYSLKSPYSKEPECYTNRRAQP